VITAALRELLAGAQVERDAPPAVVVDEHLKSDERLGLRVGGDALLVEIAVVLAAHDPRGIERSKRPEDVDLAGDQLLRSRRRGRLHRDEAHDLEQVRDDHVAEGSRALVEAGSAAD